MKRFGLVVTLGLGLYFLCACSSTKTEVNATMLQDVSTSTPASQTTIPPQNTPELALFELGEPGPYFVGNRGYTIVDESRSGREIEIQIRYPALKQTDTDGHVIFRDAEADRSDAPYPVILTERIRVV